MDRAVRGKMVGAAEDADKNVLGGDLQSKKKTLVGVHVEEGKLDTYMDEKNTGDNQTG